MFYQPRSQGLLRFQDGGRHLESGVDPGNEVGVLWCFGGFCPKNKGDKGALGTFSGSATAFGAAHPTG